MRRFDVAVIGSGPAGAACALRLARRGIATALVDPRPFPRSKLCGEYLNLGAIQELNDLGVAASLQPLAAPLNGMRLHAHGEVAEFRLPSRAWSLSRTELDQCIRTAALDAGAVPVAARVRGLAYETDGIGLKLSDGAGEQIEINARYVVGADGMRSTIAKLCNLSLPGSEQCFAVGGHFEAQGLSGWIEMYARAGEYLALNPLDDVTANGVFVVSKQRLLKSRGSLAEELHGLSRDLTGGHRAVPHAFGETANAIGPLAHRTARAASKRVLLVGDAAAFVDPFTGQGVFLALAAAKHAAHSIERALAHSRLEHQAWDEYARHIEERVRERDRVARMMKLMLAVRFAARRAAAALRRRPADFTFLVDAVCGNTRTESALQLAGAVAKVLR